MEEISYLCSDSVWKIEPYDSKHIVVELRNKNSFHTEWKLFSLDNQEAKSIFIEENSWWYSLADVTPPYLFFHKLRQGKNPEISELVIYNTELNTLEHRLEQHYLEEIKSDGILVRNNISHSEFKPLKLDSKTFNLSTPSIYSTENEYFNHFTEIISQYSKAVPVLQCEYLEHLDYILIGYYLKKDSFFECFLLILDANGDLLLNECLHKRSEGITNGTFFALENKIIYVKEEKNIHVLSI